MINTSFENFIVETIIEDLKTKYRDGGYISNKIKEEWDCRKKKVVHPDIKVLIIDFVWPLLSSLDDLPSILDYRNTINSTLLKLNKEYEEYYNLINSLYRTTSRHRDSKNYPLKWMEGDKQIKENMSKKKNKHFFNLFNFIAQTRTGRVSSSDHAFRNKIGKCNEKFDYIIYRPKTNYIDLKENKQLASLSKSKIYLYLRECVRHEIFIDKFNGEIHKDPKTKTKIYAIGYYSEFPGGFKRMYFLSKKRHLQSLREFDAEYYKKSKKRNELLHSDPIGEIQKV